LVLDSLNFIVGAKQGENQGGERQLQKNDGAGTERGAEVTEIG